jgi:triosephosphate isomerase
MYDVSVPKKFLIAANWKMHHTPLLTAAGKSQTTSTKSPINAYRSRENVDVVVFPTFLDLEACIEAGLIVGAQWGHPEDTGAHTGDLSMKMIADLGCTYVLCGHSERRRDHGESDAFVAAQVISALRHGLRPILCIGETWEERKAGKSKEVVETQLEVVLETLQRNLSEGEGLVGPAPAGHRSRKSGLAGGKPGVSLLRIAYEPVWGISGGDPNRPAATPEDAQEMHMFVRSQLIAHSSKLAATHIIYGGSMKPENAEKLLKQPDVDGGLVGHASLNPKKFAEIVRIAQETV